MSETAGKKAAIFTLGCKVNQYDEMIIARRLFDAGFEIVPFTDDADLYIINSCTVTHRADADSRKAARNALRRNPDAFVAMVGCYCKRAANEITKISGIDLVLGNYEKYNLTAFLPDDLKKQTPPIIKISDSEPDRPFGDSTIIPISRSRAILKIQDGCDQFCSYCIVPHVRGEPQSLENRIVLERIGELVAKGYREIVLTGVHIGLWGRERKENLGGLIKDINDLDGEFRIRISSIEPMELNNDLIDSLIESPRVCRHLHIPVQSLSDKILKAMNRSCTVSDIADKITRVKASDSGWNIGTDLMIGFPLETSDDFIESVNNLNNLPFDYLHLFTYSPRKGTAAADLDIAYSSNELKSRLNALKMIDKKRRSMFIKSQNMRILSFITEKKLHKNTDTIYGLSDNYIRAKFDKSAADFKIIRAKFFADTMEAIIT